MNVWTPTASRNNESDKDQKAAVPKGQRQSGAKPTKKVKSPKGQIRKALASKSGPMKEGAVEENIPESKPNKTTEGGGGEESSTDGEGQADDESGGEHKARSSHDNERYVEFDQQTSQT